MPLTFWAGVVVAAVACGIAFATFVWVNARWWRDR